MCMDEVHVPVLWLLPGNRGIALFGVHDLVFLTIQNLRNSHSPCYFISLGIISLYDQFVCAIMYSFSALFSNAFSFYSSSSSFSASFSSSTQIPLFSVLFIISTICSLSLFLFRLNFPCIFFRTPSSLLIFSFSKFVHAQPSSHNFVCFVPFSCLSLCLPICTLMDKL